MDYPHLNPPPDLKMKAVIFSSVGAEPKVGDVPIPEPGDGQVLLKSLWAAINPIDTFSATTGLLVVGWPLTLGADGCGIITKRGPNVPAHLSLGTYVFGCTRLGSPGHGSAAEYFLMDAQVSFIITPKMKDRGIGAPGAATLGASVETACLGLFEGLDVPLSALEHPQSASKDEWILVLGGASSVGKSAVQLARAAGYKVLTSCSPSSGALVEKLGAEWFSYKDTIEEQVRTVFSKTGGKVSRIFDAVASNDPVLAKEVFKQIGDGKRYFATTNDWSGIKDFEGGTTYGIALGVVGRPEGVELNEKVEKYIAACTKLLEEGKLVPSDYEVVGDGGCEAAIEAYKYQQTGKAGNKKVIVKIQDE